MIARWIWSLDTYDFDIVNRKGTLHGNADGLSRRPSKKCKRSDCPQCNNKDETHNCLVTAVTMDQDLV